MWGDMDRIQAMAVITGAGYGAALDRLLEQLADEPPLAAVLSDVADELALAKARAQARRAVGTGTDKPAQERQQSPG